jgi:CheY-like chemotaxis protein
VLAVDDEWDALAWMALILRASGASVRTAGSAHTGLGVLATWSPDVVLSDIDMPEHDGYAFIAQVRRLPGPQASIPAIAVTAHTAAADRQRAVAAGFTAHLSKPVEPVQLITLVWALTLRSRPASRETAATPAPRSDRRPSGERTLSAADGGVPQRDWRALGHWLFVWLTVGIASLAVGGLLPGPRQQSKDPDYRATLAAPASGVVGH